jgi:hypothetical protein
MVNTTSIDYRHVIIMRGLAVVIFLLSSMLFFTALPRLRSSLNHIPVDSALSELDNNRQINDQRLSKLIAIAQADIVVYDHAQYWQDASILLAYQAQRQTDQDSLQQAKHSIEQSLARSPANPYLWYKLATLDILLHQPAHKIAKTLLLSMMTGPNELGYLLPRLNLSLMLFNQLTKDDIDIVREQILTAWKMSPTLFAMTFAYDEKSIDIINNLLKDDSPTVLKEIIASHEKVN